ncbi:hypothetical protein P153DRAFT_377112 [Dothidotthia symphoricarpi CBS 119687]|uniref:Uncharacterized protein n=1 Tax=Dothidotthia symphoricarpi CBS 119687 TaxID=1392245 RepID=A0A6A6A6R2_9PLEO|nr:uncharacterized protein P153DRAFT_377112 [Dothidotthia symphoricarpi CBS 119687]KAF2127500.1 hypothetical protein P153DRAFT_377112 [Dothidotthia symphoricarpi CBS 119687]
MTHPTPVFTPTTELHDLGRQRFDHDTAAISDRDHAFHTAAPPPLRTGRAPAGLEAQVFGWTEFQYATADRDAREELKGDLHGGVLHRVNRAAGGGENIRGGGGGGFVGGRSGGGRGDGKVDALCAGRRPEGVVAPLAKGGAEELGKGMFWEEEIVCVRG